MAPSGQRDKPSAATGRNGSGTLRPVLNPARQHRHVTQRAQGVPGRRQHLANRLPGQATPVRRTLCARFQPCRVCIGAQAPVGCVDIRKTSAAARQPSQAPTWRCGCGAGGMRRQFQDSGRRRKGATVPCRANQRGKRDDQHTASDLRNRRGIGRRCPRPSPRTGRTVMPVLRREIHERRLAQSPVPQVPQA